MMKNGDAGIFPVYYSLNGKYSNGLSGAVYAASMESLCDVGKLLENSTSHNTTTTAVLMTSP